MPWPSSSTHSRTSPFSRAMPSHICVAPEACALTLSNRLMSTCSISVPSMGTSNIVSVESTFTGSASGARWYLRMALPTISSNTSSVFLSTTSPPLNRVMDSRFSVTRTSHWASRPMPSASASRSSWDSAGSLSAELAPSMEASGVRMSWAMARSRLACIFSRSASKRSCSWRLTCVVKALMNMETTSIIAKVSG